MSKDTRHQPASTAVPAAAGGGPVDETARVMDAVRARLKALGLSDGEASRRIGVTPASMQRHLAGSYVRGDSLVKYRRWLATDGQAVSPPPAREKGAGPRTAPRGRVRLVDPLTGPPVKPSRPHRVVDLFGGCGGLSLGFELAGGGGIFRTTLAVDIEEQMVRVFNANHPAPSPHRAVGRQADLSEFMNEAEVLAYYLDHVATVEGDVALRAEVNAIEPFGLDCFLAAIRECDAAFVEDLAKVRSAPEFARAYSRVPKTSLSQTSVLGFHRALKLPQPGLGTPNFDAPLWGGSPPPPRGTAAMTVSKALRKETHASAVALWKEEIERLRERATGSGTGQLASAAEKIADSLVLIDGAAYADVRAAWVKWRTDRDGLRRAYFEDEEVLVQLRRAYKGERTIQVLLGGPPCQGFSRIGRGKIRSLREQSVHVQSDAHAGDKRNELMHQYILFVAALAPPVFLFENVRHFQAEVQTPEGTFNATEVLAEAIANLSRDGQEYAVSSRVVSAVEHLVPQTRERFFMVGVRADVERSAARKESAAWCLTLPEHPPVPLKTALSGLPEPVYASATAERGGGTDARVSVEDVHIRGSGPNGQFFDWIRQSPPADRRQDHRLIDAHCTRDSRPDDRAFFELLGPGKRWMDYRSDDSPLIDDLSRLVRWALTDARRAGLPAGLDAQRLTELQEALDGSLPIRLLLDKIPLTPGEHRHHLTSPTYLKKRDGNHGDWLARLDAEGPSKTMVSHMGKDTYGYVHPSAPRTISVREAARVQTFPDWYSFGAVGLVDAYRVIGNAVPPLLSAQLALRVGSLLHDGLCERVDRAPKRPGVELAPAPP